VTERLARSRLELRAPGSNIPHPAKLGEVVRTADKPARRRIAVLLARVRVAEKAERETLATMIARGLPATRAIGGWA
jgi:hypothetical protein